MSGIERTVGRYELLDILGRGGAGIVYRARQTDLDRLVALKQVVNLGRGDTELARRFLREARLAGGLSHPNIVPVFEYLEHDGEAYIAMELLPHGSLRAHIGRLDLAQVGGVLEGILAALSYASSRLVHRDIKPENVLVGPDGRIKLADFGIARAIDVTTAASGLTASGAIIGSPAYMAPEQARGDETGPATDLFSVGVVAFEMLVGERPHPPASGTAEALKRLVDGQVRRPLQLRPSLDPGLAAWLERMLETDPRDRHSDAGQAWDDVEEHLIRLLGERWRRRSALAVRSSSGLDHRSAPPGVPPPESGAAARDASRPLDTTQEALEPAHEEIAHRRAGRLLAVAVALAVLAAVLTAVAILVVS